MWYFDLNVYYGNRVQKVSPEVFYAGREKTVLRPDLIKDVLPKIVQLVLENAKWRPPEIWDWILIDKNKVATWEIYRLEVFINNHLSINLMPKQVPPMLELRNDSNGALIWVRDKAGLRIFDDYVDLEHIKDTDISVKSDSGYFVLEILCSRMIKLARNVGALTEEIEDITNVLYQ